MSERVLRVLLLLLLALTALLISRLEPVRVLEGALYDRALAWNGEGMRDPRIVVIGIDPASLEALGPFPWPRSIHARLLEVLRRQGAEVVFFDLLFDTPGTRGVEDDREFARALKRFGKVVLASSVSEQDARENRMGPLLPMLAESARCGVINRKRDPDGVIRWGILAVAALEPPAPSAALQMLRLDSDDPPCGFQPDQVTLGDRRIPTSGSEPFEVPIRFRTSPPPLSYVRVLREEVAQEELRGRLVLVGAHGTETQVDTFATPSGWRPGVEIHAALLDTLLAGRFIRRVSPAWDFLTILLACLVTGTLVGRARSAPAAALAAGLVATLLLVGFVVLLRRGWWIGALGPVLGVFMAFGLAWILRLVQVRNLLAQFVAPSQVGEMLKSDQATSLGGNQVQATVFFTDIRGYTTLSESRSPVEVMEILNQYHSRVGEIYARRGGTVMTYQGDAQIVLFQHQGLQGSLAVVRAVQAGLEMQQAIEGMRQQWALGPDERFEVGVGICSGPVSVVTVGAESHKQFTILGDTVRRASEVQGLSASLEAPVLLDPVSRELAGGAVLVDPTGPVELPGSAEPVLLYRARGVSEQG